MGGLAAVKYTPCGDVEVIERCSIPGSYVYTPAKPSADAVAFESAGAMEERVYGIARLERAAKTARLTLRYTIGGTSDVHLEPEAEVALRAPECAEATHVVTYAMLGAIRVSRTDDDVTLEAAGDPAACRVAPDPLHVFGATPDARAKHEPPDPDCAALLQIALVSKADAPGYFAKLREIETQADALQKELLDAPNADAGPCTRCPDGSATRDAKRP
jgi:hypothetical protein